MAATELKRTKKIKNPDKNQLGCNVKKMHIQLIFKLCFCQICIVEEHCEICFKV